MEHKDAKVSPMFRFEGFLDKGWLLNEIQGVFMMVLNFRFDKCKEKIHFAGHVDGKVVSLLMFFSIPT